MSGLVCVRVRKSAGCSTHAARKRNVVLEETWSSFSVGPQDAEGYRQAEQAAEARRDDASARLRPLRHGAASV